MHRTLLCAVAMFATLPLAGLADADEAAADPKYTWDLTDLYPTVDDWNRAREESRRGTLGDSADSLYQKS